MKSDGKPILSVNHVAVLLEAVLLPSEIAVCKCQARLNEKDDVSRGNARADSAAKSAALSKHFYTMLVTTINISPSEAVLAV